MNKLRKKNWFRIIYCLIFASLLCVPVKAGHDDILNRSIKLEKQSGYVYDLLEEISRQIGYLFIYDSDFIKNERKVKLKKTTKTVRQAIYDIVGDNQARIDVIGRSILIGRSKPKPAQKQTPSPAPEIKSAFLTFEGTLLDKYSKQPVDYVTLEILNTSITGMTNQDGKFRMTIPDSLSNHRLRFSLLGYASKEISLSLFKGRKLTILLEPKLFSVRGFIVRPADPVKLLRAVLDGKDKNYQNIPVYLTSFYREGVKQGKDLVGLTEAVIKVYKSPSDAVYSNDQVKILKMRQVKSDEEKVNLGTKLESGIGACLQTDILKELPDFLSADLMSDQYYKIYDYEMEDIILLDDRQINVISFQPHKNIKEPLFCGKLYVDAENSAIVRAEYEFVPKYIRKLSNVLVTKKSRGIKVIPKKLSYKVQYKLLNNRYYLNYARGDLSFKIRKKNSPFSGITHQVWFEMVACETETNRVRLLGYNEVVPTTTVFSDIKYTYDDDFWGDFNVIPIEEELYKAVHVISEKIKEIRIIN